MLTEWIIHRASNFSSKIRKCVYTYLYVKKSRNRGDYGGELQSQRLNKVLSHLIQNFFDELALADVLHHIPKPLATRFRLVRDKRLCNGID